MNKLGLDNKAQAVAYFADLVTQPSVAARLDAGGILYFLNSATFIDSRTGATVEGYLNSTFSSEAIRRGNINIFNDLLDKIVETDDEV